MAIIATVLNQEAWPYGKRLSRRKTMYGNWKFEKTLQVTLPLRRGHLLSSFENHSSLSSMKIHPFGIIHGICSLKAILVLSLDLGSAFVQSLFLWVCFRFMFMRKFLERLVIIPKSLCSSPTLSPVCCTCCVHSLY